MRQAAPGPPGVVSFEARTFDRLPITNARFMPDGKTIVYSATPGGSPPELFVINPAAEAPQPLGLVECAPALDLEQAASWPSSWPRGSSINASTAARWPA